MAVDLDMPFGYPHIIAGLGHAPWMPPTVMTIEPEHAPLTQPQDFLFIFGMIRGHVQERVWVQ